MCSRLIRGRGTRIRRVPSPEINTYMLTRRYLAENPKSRLGHGDFGLRGVLRALEHIRCGLTAQPIFCARAAKFLAAVPFATFFKLPSMPAFMTFMV